MIFEGFFQSALICPIFTLFEKKYFFFQSALTWSQIFRTLKNLQVRCNRALQVKMLFFNSKRLHQDSLCPKIPHFCLYQVYNVLMCIIITYVLYIKKYTYFCDVNVNIFSNVKRSQTHNECIHIQHARRE